MQSKPKKLSSKLYKALLINILQEIVSTDTSLSMSRLKLHIKNNYDLDVEVSELQREITNAAIIVSSAKLKRKKHV